MAQGSVRLRVTVDTSQLQAALNGLRWPLSAVTRQTLRLIRDNRRMSPRLFACVAWPAAWRKGGRAMHGATGNATQRLRAAAKAGLAHVAFEQGEETYEISASGRTAMGQNLRVERWANLRVERVPDCAGFPS